MTETEARSPALKASEDLPANAEDGVPKSISMPMRKNSVPTSGREQNGGASVAPIAAAAAAESRQNAQPLLPQTPDEEPVVATSQKQWLVLFAFALNTALNSFLSVNFAVVEELTRETLDVDKAAVAWLYTGFLLTVAVGMFPGLLLVTNCEAIALGSSVACNVTCTWVRWIGVKNRSYPLVLFSAVLNAAGAWVILPLPAQLSQQRFPPSWWTLTTSIAIQANYCGWLLGSVLPPNLIQTPSDMERFMFFQALVSLPVALAFFVFYRPPKQRQRLAGESSRLALGESVISFRGEAPFDDVDRQASINRIRSSSSIGNADPETLDNHGNGTHNRGSLKQFFRTLCRYPRFGMQVLAYGMLGGVSFAFPGCDDSMLEPHGFSTKTVATVNAVFLSCGIVSGLLFGANCTARNYGKVLKTLFIICGSALVVLATMVGTGMLTDAGPKNLTIVIILFAFIGMSSLGFIGLGIEAAALYPAGGAYVCFTIEGLVQIFGAFLNQIGGSGDDGFLILAFFATFAAVLLVFSYRDFKDEPLGTRSWRNADSTDQSAATQEEDFFSPNLNVVNFNDPRAPGQKIAVVGFFHPGRDDPCDKLCGAPFLGNFWELGSGRLKLAAPNDPAEVSFGNSEAAFQALKFWKQAQQYAPLSGDDAVRLSQKNVLSSGSPDDSCCGYGSNWSGMLAVLRVKFSQPLMGNALLLTGDAFLLEHNPVEGCDKVWSDNCKGDGTNWLGMQLMMIRDELSSRSAWTNCISKHIDLNSGIPRSASGRDEWQSIVEKACLALVNALASGTGAAVVASASSSAQADSTNEVFTDDATPSARAAG